MNILPQVKSWNKKDGYISLKKFSWSFAPETDERVMREAYRICEDTAGGYPITINSGYGKAEGYEMEIGTEGIKISSDGAAGAFYALQSLKQLIKNTKGIPCGTIRDFPDMEYRGFYQDITRGKIPTVQSLKKLADTLSLCKLNSLQLYVEHVFEFPEYEPCREKLGYISEAELRELDEYCHERFIDLVPSLSCFGHLYHLLQDCGYSELCEIPDHAPYNHYWFERMVHHTINPESPESFKLISGMIDRYMSVFQSEYFNICGDETFDLGMYVNKGKDKGRLYFDFVKKLIDHVKAKGKKPMMWADVILNHPEYIEKLPAGITYLNWNYSSRVAEEGFKKLGELSLPQIVCPGTSSWNSFCENVEIEEKNISLLAKYGHRHNAKGLLNTSWGDMGNICTINMNSYGIMCGACISWDKATVFDKSFRACASEFIYGNVAAIDIVAGLSPFLHIANWKSIVRFDGLNRVDTASPNFETARLLMELMASEREEPEVYEQVIDKCFEAEKELAKLKGLKNDFYTEILLAIRGTALLSKWNAACRFYKLDCYVDYEDFREQYQNLWLKDNKKSELSEVLAVFDRAQGQWASI